MKRSFSKDAPAEKVVEYEAEEVASFPTAGADAPSSAFDGYDRLTADDDDEGTETQLCATETQTSSTTQLCATETQTSSTKLKRRTSCISFGEVSIYSHAPALAGDRLPASDGPSIGLGKLTDVQLRRIDSYDVMRNAERTGVRHIDAHERIASLLLIHRSASIDAVTMEHDITRAQRAETLAAVAAAGPSPSTVPPSADSAAAHQLAFDALLGSSTERAKPQTVNPSASWSLLARLPAFQDDTIGLTDLW